MQTEVSDAKRMIRAAKAGDVETVSALLKADPSLVHARDADGSTPLHCAAWKGHPEVATALLNAGADIQARNSNSHWGDSALHAAAHGNQRAVAQILIERGADLEALNAEGKTPLQQTEPHNATAVANLLKRALSRQK